MISVIMPVYNDERRLRESEEFLMKLRERAELIFADGGGSDRTVEVAAIFGKVLSGGRGRAAQMNLGAEEATSDVLLFLHPDNAISPETVTAVEDAVKNKGLAGGCLTQSIDGEGLLLRILEVLCNIRARVTRIFYLDQGIFVRKDVFRKIGGFPEVPVMEDALFCRKLRKNGKTEVLGETVSVPAGKFEKRGVVRTFFLYCSRSLLFTIRVPVSVLNFLYGGLR